MAPSCTALVSSHQMHLLRRGRVPTQSRLHVQRATLVEKLSREVVDLWIKGKSSKQWLVVHGMPGAGKSRLVSGLLWERPELSLAHFDRVIWVTDRNATEEGVADVANDAIILLSASDSDYPESQKLSVVAKRMNRELELLGSQRVLFVLDGVITAETVRFFDEQVKSRNCFVIATSTSVELFSFVDAAFFPVGVDDFSPSDLEVLAHSTALNLSTDDVEELHAACGGNAAMVEKVLLLAGSRTEVIPSLLHRLRSRPLEELACISSYHYPNMDIPIAHCFEMVEERIRSSFNFWTVFEPNKWTSFNVLALNWPLDLCGWEKECEVQGMVLQDLRHLANNSLLDTSARDRRERKPLYRINPLIRSHMLHSMPDGYYNFKRSYLFLVGKLDELAEHGNEYDAYREANVVPRLNREIEEVEAMELAAERSHIIRKKVRRGKLVALKFTAHQVVWMGGKRMDAIESIIKRQKKENSTPIVMC